MLLPKVTRLQVFTKYDGKCAYCGKELEWFKRENEFHVDHLVPRNSGGHNEMENLMPSCQYCNFSKGIKSLEEWRYRLMRKKLGWPNIAPHIVEFLKSRGIDLDQMVIEEIENAPKHIFYFEET